MHGGKAAAEAGRRKLLCVFRFKTINIKSTCVCVFVRTLYTILQPSYGRLIAMFVLWLRHPSASNLQPSSCKNSHTFSCSSSSGGGGDRILRDDVRSRPRASWTRRGGTGGPGCRSRRSCTRIHSTGDVLQIGSLVNFANLDSAREVNKFAPLHLPPLLCRVADDFEDSSGPETSYS